MGRRRSAKTRGLPPNLYQRSNGYFAWRDSRDGKEYGLGYDRRSAVAQAIEANHEVEGTRGKRVLVDRLITGKDNSVSVWCDRYQQILDERKLKQSTRDSFCQRLKKVRAEWGEMRIDAVTTRDVADFLDKWERDGKKRMGQAMRSFVIDLFKAAQAKGWVSSNPAEPTKAPIVEVHRARLTLDDFLAIHTVAVEQYASWLARSMELALVTGQRREDIANMGARSVHQCRLWVEQGKTGAKVCIPLDLRLQAVNWSVGEVVARCRDNVLSHYFVHHSAFAGRAKPGDKVRLHTISAWFAEARDRASLKWPAGSTPPSFHEIRSLAARLFTEQGIDAQALLGHKSADMTALYRDSRGAEWVEVRTS